MVEVTAGLKVYTPADTDAYVALAQKILSTRKLQVDDMVRDPVRWCVEQFSNPHNTVFDVCDGAGVIAFLYTVPTWRTAVTVAAWERTAARRDDLFKLACQVTFESKNLLVVDAFVADDNKLAQRAAERVGFTYRGTVQYAAWYNGQPEARFWYELPRQDVLGKGA